MVTELGSTVKHTKLVSTEAKGLVCTWVKLESESRPSLNNGKA